MSEENKQLEGTPIDPKMQTDYERARDLILNDPNYTDEQKKAMVQNLANNWKKVNISISNEIPQKTQEDIEIAQRTRETLRLKFTELGLDCPRLETLEDMDRASEIWKALKERNKSQESPSGSAPLEGQYLGMKGSEHGFETREAMVDALRFQEKFGETDEIKKNATQILEQLFRKWVNAKKNDPNLVDRIPENLLETPIEHKKRTRKKREQ